MPSALEPRWVTGPCQQGCDSRRVQTTQAPQRTTPTSDEDGAERSGGQQLRGPGGRQVISWAGINPLIRWQVSWDPLTKGGGPAHICGRGRLRSREWGGRSKTEQRKENLGAAAEEPGPAGGTAAHAQGGSAPRLPAAVPQPLLIQRPDPRLQPANAALGLPGLQVGPGVGDSSGELGQATGLARSLDMDPRRPGARGGRKGSVPGEGSPQG